MSADTTQPEMDAQIALSDYRLRVVRGDYIAPEEYRDLIASLQGGRASRARALAEAAKDKAKAKRATRTREPLDIAAMFAASLAQVEQDTDADA